MVMINDRRLTACIYPLLSEATPNNSFIDLLFHRYAKNFIIQTLNLYEY